MYASGFWKFLSELLCHFFYSCTSFPISLNLTSLMSFLTYNFRDSCDHWLSSYFLSHVFKNNAFISPRPRHSGPPLETFSHIVIFFTPALLLTFLNNFHQRDMLGESNEEGRQRNLGSVHMGKSRKGSLLGLNSLCRRSPILEDVPPAYSQRSSAPSGLRGSVEGNEALLP